MYLVRRELLIHEVITEKMVKTIFFKEFRKYTLNVKTMLTIPILFYTDKNSKKFLMSNIGRVTFRIYTIYVLIKYCCICILTKNVL